MSDDLDALDQEDITNYDHIIAEVASDWATHVSGYPMIAANFVLVIDARGTDAKNGIAVLSPKGMPPWLKHSLLAAGHDTVDAGFQFMGEGWEDEEDE